MDPGRPARGELRHLHGRRGPLVFDVNDFDEAYLGHFTWDLRRFVASLALMGWQKALPDDAISELCAAYLRAYVEQVSTSSTTTDDDEWPRCAWTPPTGAVHAVLQRGPLATRIDLLDAMTVVERLRTPVPPRRRDARAGPARAQRGRAGLRGATWTPSRRQAAAAAITYRVKDVVGTSGFGIGSAGLPAYNMLVEGHTQALENDVVLSMKQGNVAAPSRIVDDEAPASTSSTTGHRTAVSQRALQAHADPWLGWTELDGTGYVVAELSPYEADLDWSDLTEPEDIAPWSTHLGRATAKVHCVADEDATQTPLVDFQTEEAIVAAIGERRGRASSRDLVGLRARVRASGPGTTTRCSSTRSAPVEFQGCRPSPEPYAAGVTTSEDRSRRHARPRPRPSGCSGAPSPCSRPGRCSAAWGSAAPSRSAG